MTPTPTQAEIEALDRAALETACEAAEAAYLAEPEEGLAFGEGVEAGIRSYLAATRRLLAATDGAEKVTLSLDARELVDRLRNYGKPDPNIRRLMLDAAMMIEYLAGRSTAAATDGAEAVEPLPKWWRPSHQMTAEIRELREHEEAFAAFDGDRRGIAAAIIGARSRVVGALHLNTDGDEDADQDYRLIEACANLIVRMVERRSAAPPPPEVKAEAKVVVTEYCDVPSAGWRCTREKGHDGPCAAVASPSVVGPATAYQRAEESICTCSAVGSGESHEPWCPWEDSEWKKWGDAFDVAHGEAPPAPSQELSAARRVRHKKTGGEYAVIGVGRMQASNWEEREYTATDAPVPGASVDMHEVTIYRALKDGSLWVRPVEEFEDGRFEPLTRSALKEGERS